MSPRKGQGDQSKGGKSLDSRTEGHSGTNSPDSPSRVARHGGHQKKDVQAVSPIHVQNFSNQMDSNFSSRVED